MSDQSPCPDEFSTHVVPAGALETLLKRWESSCHAAGLEKARREVLIVTRGELAAVLVEHAIPAAVFANAAAAGRPLEPWDELEAAAEEQDPGHLLRVNQELRATIDGLRRTTLAAITERTQLVERLTTIADETNGPHPVQEAQDSLKCIERALFEWRARVAELEAELGRLKQPDGYSEEYIEASLRRFAKKLETTRQVASRHLFTAAELLRFTAPDTRGSHG